MSAEIKPWDTMCFHLQQAFEKAIKALLTYKNIEYPLVHDLGVLLKMLSKSLPKFAKKYKKLIDINDYAVEARYDFEWEGVDSEEFDSNFQLIKDALREARELIS